MTLLFARIERSYILLRNSTSHHSRSRSSAISRFRSKYIGNRLHWSIEKFPLNFNIPRQKSALVKGATLFGVVRAVEAVHLASRVRASEMRRTDAKMQLTYIWMFCLFRPCVRAKNCLQTQPHPRELKQGRDAYQEHLTSSRTWRNLLRIRVNQ